MPTRQIVPALRIKRSLPTARQLACDTLQFNGSFINIGKLQFKVIGHNPCSGAALIRGNRRIYPARPALFETALSWRRSLPPRFPRSQRILQRRHREHQTRDGAGWSERGQHVADFGGQEAAFRRDTTAAASHSPVSKRQPPSTRPDAYAVTGMPRPESTADPGKPDVRSVQGPPPQPGTRLDQG